jgi:hypothetical protein
MELKNEMSLLEEQNKILQDIADNIKAVNIKTDKVILLLKKVVEKTEGAL